jgi:hypothetical protein
VSSSGALLFSNDGPLIDKFTIVARVGTGPLYPKRHVGSRSTVRFVAESAFDQANLSEVLEIAKSGEQLIYILQSSSACSTEIVDFHRDQNLSKPSCINKYNRCTERLLGTRFGREWEMSAGFASVFLLFKLFPCRSVQLFGFTTIENAPYHYWTAGTKHDGVTSRRWYNSRLALKGHNFRKEHFILKRLGRGGLEINRSVAQTFTREDCFRHYGLWPHLNVSGATISSALMKGEASHPVVSAGGGKNKPVGWVFGCFQEIPSNRFMGLMFGNDVLSITHYKP